MGYGRGVAALRAQGLDSRTAPITDGKLVAGPLRTIGFCRSNYRTLIRLVCCGAQRPSNGFGPTSRRPDGRVIFGLRPPAPCTVAAGGGLLVTTLPPPAKSASHDLSFDVAEALWSSGVITESCALI